MVGYRYFLENMMPHIQKTGYGFLVSVGQGAWRFSFVEKEGTGAYELGNHAGPNTPSFARLEAERIARLTMLAAGHRIVV